MEYIGKKGRFSFVNIALDVTKQYYYQRLKNDWKAKIKSLQAEKTILTDLMKEMLRVTFGFYRVFW